MPLRFYNTLSRSVEDFEPLVEGRATIYACGPTVYQLPHIGNYRTFLFNDLLHRYLEWRGYEVRFVMNLTDVDDKTIDGATDQGTSLDEFCAPVIEAFFDDLARLGVRPADAYPRATRHIDRMVDLVSSLLERGHAYRVGDEVYYDVSSFERYGELSRIDPEQMRAGAGLAERAAIAATGKKDTRDFALWKAAKEIDRRVGAVWETPWGAGRPGWHLECSAMSMAELGETFDIHTGGEDLVFPHHEDEIAQSEGATGKPFVRYWLHVKHLVVSGEKMSKSLGNVFTLRELIDEGHSPAAIRYLLLSAHYRHNLNFTVDGLEDAANALDRLRAFDDRLARVRTDDNAEASRLPDRAARAIDAFRAALDDDLNTPEALAALFNFVRETNAELDRHRVLRPAERDEARRALARIDEVLGVVELARRDAERVDADLADWVERKIEERQRARGRRDFAAADAIRDELAERGVVVEDTPEGPRWKLVSA